MSEQLSKVDNAQLERWAYGRASNPDEQARAIEAATELQRRADSERDLLERVEAERIARESLTPRSPDDGTHDVVGRSSESRAPVRTRFQGRRLLLMGIGTVAAVAVVLGASILLREPPADPLAIFEREETQLDRNWTSRLEGWGYSNATAGPRATEVGDGYVLIAARFSTVPDGRSTAWDSYCLFVASPGSDGVSWGLSERCTHPEKFAREGISIPERQSILSDGIDTATWGPSGDPRFDSVKEGADPQTQTQSILDLLATPREVLPGGSDLLARVDERETLLMGPRLVHEVPLSSGEAVRVQLYLREASSGAAESGPELCMQVAYSETSATGLCETLESVLTNGIFLNEVIGGESWIVGVDSTGEARAEPS